MSLTTTTFSLADLEVELFDDMPMLAQAEVLSLLRAWAVLRALRPAPDGDDDDDDEDDGDAPMWFDGDAAEDDDDTMQVELEIELEEFDDMELSEQRRVLGAVRGVVWWGEDM